MKITFLSRAHDNLLRCTPRTPPNPILGSGSPHGEDEKVYAAMIRFLEDWTGVIGLALRRATLPDLTGNAPGQLPLAWVRRPETRGFLLQSVQARAAKAESSGV